MLTLTQIMKVGKLMAQTSDRDSSSYNLRASNSTAKRSAKKVPSVRYKPVDIYRSNEILSPNVPDFLRLFPQASRQSEPYQEAEITLDSGRAYNVQVLGRKNQSLLVRAKNNKRMEFNAWKIKEYRADS
ncbi:MAG: hypothetical protein AABY10_05995 [Nanoarchaeota archaeon]